jgi:N-glycosylase/DNA lyase
MARSAVNEFVPKYRDLEPVHLELRAKLSDINARLADFRRVGAGTDEQLFEELAFALLAIQSSARSSDSAIRALVDSELLWNGDAPSIARFLQHRTRFHNHKARYLVQARDRFLPVGDPRLRAALDRFPSNRDARTWLVEEVDGLGMKEASHFLRNVGRGEDLAILDRHILRNALRHRVIGRMPRSLTPKRYLAIEDRLIDFAESLGTTVAVLDLLWWSRETGEIFK